MPKQNSFTRYDDGRTRVTFPTSWPRKAWNEWVEAATYMAYLTWRRNTVKPKWIVHRTRLGTMDYYVERLVHRIKDRLRRDVQKTGVSEVFVRELAEKEGFFVVVNEPPEPDCDAADGGDEIDEKRTRADRPAEHMAAFRLRPSNDDELGDLEMEID